MNLLEEVKSINIKHLIERETNAKFTARNQLPECPFCGSGTGKNKSSAFSIHTEKNFYKCFSCGSQGTTIDFILNKQQGWDSKMAVRYLNKTYLNRKLHVPKPIRELTSLQKMIFAIKNNPVEKATSYLQSRKIDTNLLPDGSYFYDKLQNSVVFLDSAQKLINRRIITPTPSTPKAKNIGTLNGSIYDALFKPSLDTVFLHEGVINTLSMSSYSGIAIFSSENKIRNLSVLKRYITRKHVVIAFDNDDAGIRCSEYYQGLILSGRFDIKSLKRLVLPPDMDINDLLVVNSLKTYFNNKSHFQLVWEDIASKPIAMDSEDKLADNEEYYFYKENGCYFSKETFRGKPVTKKLSNFTMEIIYHLVNGTKDSSRIIKFQRHSKEIVVEELFSSELNLERFKKIIRSISGKGLSFFGSTAQLEYILAYLQDWEKKAEAITQLGYQPASGNYCFSDAIITRKNQMFYPDKLGIVDTGADNKYYLPAGSFTNQNNEAYRSQRRFAFKEGAMDFEKWAGLIQKAYGLNGAIGVSFVILALFRDYVMRETGFFPFLFLFGDQGAGKSNFINFFLRLFGEPGNGISLLNSTDKGFSRSLTQRKNALYYLKEYTNAIDRKTVDIFKTGYDGELYTMAQKSNDTKTVTLEISSACMVDGNELPTSAAALFSRMIVLHFESNKFTDESTQAYKSLLNNRDRGFGQVTREIHQHRKNFEKSFCTVFENIFEELKTNKANGLSVSDRQFRHMALILSPIKILDQCLTFPISYSDFSEKVIQSFKIQEELSNEIKDVTIFWESIAFKISGRHPEIKENVHYQKDVLKEVLYLKYRLVYPFYAEYVKKNNLRLLDPHSLKELLTSSSNKSFVPNKSQQTRLGKAYTKKNFGSCYMFRFQSATDQRGIVISDVELDM